MILRVLAVAALVVAAANAAGPRLADGRYLYVVGERSISVYRLGGTIRLAERMRLPQAHALRGVAAAPRTHTLFLSVGGNGGDRGNGSLVAVDLLTNRVVWRRDYSTGTDGLAVLPDGSRLYVPVGEHTMDDRWRVVDAHTGRVVTDIHAGPGPHNTVIPPDGRHAYLGPRNSHYLFVADTRTNRIVRRVGPFLPGVRPFTIDGAQRLVYTTATGVLGFQVGDLRTGRVLYTVPVRGFRPGRTNGAPSHGITLTPDSRTLFVLDVPNGYVHVYDVARVPDGPPRHLADVRLRHPLVGTETPCGGDCGRAGWLLTSLDGRYVFVGDSGDVIGVHTRRVVAFLPALANSRYPIEIDWRAGQPVATSTRSGIGRGIEPRG